MMKRWSTERRQAALQRFEHVTELPLLVLAVAMVPLLLLPVLIDVSDEMRRVFGAFDLVIWAAFAVELVVRLALTTTGRWRFLRANWADVVIVVVPFLRPLRVVRSARALRLLRLTRFVGVVGVVTRLLRRLLVRHSLHYVILVTLGVITAAAALAFAFEANQSASSINGLGDAFWWAAVTVTTVGYGDEFPITTEGRVIAVFLMVAGIAFFSVVTANIAAFFIDTDEASQTAREHALLTEIAERLARIEGTLERSA